MCVLKDKCYLAAKKYADTSDILDKITYALSLANSIKCKSISNTPATFPVTDTINCIEKIRLGYGCKICRRCLKVNHLLEKRKTFRRSLGSTKGWIRKLGKQIQVIEN